MNLNKELMNNLRIDERNLEELEVMNSILEQCGESVDVMWNMIHILSKNLINTKKREEYFNNLIKSMDYSKIVNLMDLYYRVTSIVELLPKEVGIELAKTLPLYKSVMRTVLIYVIQSKEFGFENPLYTYLDRLGNFSKRYLEDNNFIEDVCVGTSLHNYLKSKGGVSADNLSEYYKDVEMSSLLVHGLDLCIQYASMKNMNPKERYWLNEDCLMAEILRDCDLGLTSMKATLNVFSALATRKVIAPKEGLMFKSPSIGDKVDSIKLNNYVVDNCSMIIVSYRMGDFEKSFMFNLTRKYSNITTSLEIQIFYAVLKMLECELPNEEIIIMVNNINGTDIPITINKTLIDSIEIEELPEYNGVKLAFENIEPLCETGGKLRKLAQGRNVTDETKEKVSKMYILLPEGYTLVKNSKR